VPKRIAIDIDSTLHHYWDVLSAAARKRFGIDLPYDEQHTWGVTRLKEHQFLVCVAETHCERAILAGKPYPGAVETVNGWHEDGHFIHVTSHRTGAALEATDRWLHAIGLQFDDLRCDAGKVGRCQELGIDLLIDDSPLVLEQAIDAGIQVATIVHPWNRDLCDTEDIVSAPDWPELRERLAPLLGTG
jgi:uncharacterized HAD superfamily protein